MARKEGLPTSRPFPRRQSHPQRAPKNQPHGPGLNASRAEPDIETEGNSVNPSLRQGYAAKVTGRHRGLQYTISEQAAAGHQQEIERPAKQERPRDR
jgi:hypothetical protein